MLDLQQTTKQVILCFFLLFKVIYGFSQSLETVVQKGHATAVKSVCIDPSGQFLFTGSRDKTAKIWNFNTTREIRTFIGHEHTVNHVAYSASANKLLTSSADNSIKIWDIKTGDVVFEIQSKDFMTDGSWSPDGELVAVGGYEGKVEIWNIKHKKQLTSIKVNSERGLGYGLSIDFSPDGKWLAIGQDNQLLQVYNTKTWKKTFSFEIENKGYCGGCISLTSFSPNSKYLAKLSHNGSLSVYKMADTTKILHIGDRWRDIQSVQFNHQSSTLLAVTSKQALILDIHSQDTLFHVNAKKPEQFNDAVFSNDDKEIILALEDGTVKRVNIVTQEVNLTYEGILNHKNEGDLGYDPHNYWHGALAKSIKFKNETVYSPLTKTLVSGKHANKAIGWYTKSGEISHRYPGLDNSIIGLDISPDYKTLLGGDSKGKIFIWDIKTGDTLRTIKGNRFLNFETKFSSDGEHITSVNWGASIIRWNSKTGKRTSYISLDNNPAYTHAPSPNGLYAAVGRYTHNNLEIWEFDSKILAKTLIGHTARISTISFSKSANELISASWDGTAAIWNLETGLIDRKLRSSGPLYACIYSPDETEVVTGGASRSIVFWDRTTGKQQRIFKGHKAAITSLLYTPDHKTLISSDIDGTTIFWDLATGKQRFEYISIGIKDWMIKTNEGYFSATPRARQYIHFVKGLETYHLDQFFDTYYKPKKVKQLLSESSSSGDTKNISTTLSKFPPPKVRLAAIRDSKDITTATIYVKIIDQKGGVEQIKIFHNGKRLNLDSDRMTTLKSRGDTTIYTYPLSLVHGTNTFEASASSRGQIESEKVKTTLKTTLAPKKATCHILSVGINDYQNDQLDLNYARADADAFTQVLNKNAKSIFDTIILHSIYDQEATKGSILSKLDEIAEKVSLNDVFIFYYAGHGSMVDEKFYFVSSDNTRLYDAKSLEKNAINASLIHEKLTNIKALKQIIIMDACQSGSSVEVLAQRGATEEKAVAQLSRSSGVHVLASASSNQSATEFQALGHGLFTHVLLEALNGKADGAPKDGKVTVYELKSYIDDIVPESSEKLKSSPQYPFTFSRGQDFPLVLSK